MLKRMLEQLSIKKKIQSIIFLCIFFVSLTSLVCFHFISKAYEKSLYQSVSNSLSYSSENILERINNINMLSDLILSDQTIQDYLTRIQNSSSASELSINYELIYRKLINYLFNFNSNNIMNISIIINPELTVSTSTYKQQYLTAQVRDSIVQNALKEDGTAVWITDFCDDYGLFLSRELKRTYALDLDTLGVLFISVNSAAMTEDAISYHSAADNGYLLMNQGHVIYKSPKLSEDDVSLLKTFDQGYQIIRLNHQNVFAVKNIIPGIGWDYISLVPYSTIIHTIRFTKTLCIAIMILCFCLTVITSTRLLTTLIYHFDLLVIKMKRFGSGDYKPDGTISDYQNRTDEIGILHRSFDSMVLKINTLIRENYTNEILKRDAQIKAMENQINPHFLYNTLDSINWLAKAIGAQDITKLTLALGKLLRVTLKDHNTPYTIEKEIQVLDNYITIQRLRYGKRLDCQISIPEEFFPYVIPKLTIQPLLENAIHYGLEEISEVCHITVSAREDQGDIIIEVRNNGSSFDDDLINKLKTGLAYPHGHGIGLINISQRLELTYGPAYHLRLYNDEDIAAGEEYAIAQIRIPIHSIEKGDV